METLTTITRQEMTKYAGEALNGVGYLLESADGTVLATVDFYHWQGNRGADAGLIARLEHDAVVIERDMNDKPLVDALLQAGVPREKIILAYAGEAIPA
jgi:hypothetical protein